jgi:phage regulator Rha-like protein
MKNNQALPVIGAQRMTSLEIAEVTGKQHKHLMRDIRNMEAAWEKVNGSKFGLVDYRDAKGELRPCYSLSKMECLYIATKFNDEARAKLVIRWQQLEQERITQKCVRKLLVTDEDVMNEAQRIIGRTIVSFNKHADGCITASDIAEAIGMEVKDLNSFLTDKKVQKWQRGQYRLTPEYEGLGLAQDRLFIYYSKDGKQKERTYLVWTPKGAEMIDKMIFEKGKRNKESRIARI